MRIYHLENNSTIHVDFEKARITSIVAGGQELAAGDCGFYAVKLRDKTGGHRIIYSEEGRFCSFDGETACYSHKEMEVAVSARQEQNRLIWGIQVENKTEDLLEWVELMSFGVGGRLQEEEGGRGEILFPWNEGCLVRNMRARSTSPFPYMEPEYPSQGKYAVFPNMVSSQFLCYLAQGQGIYLGMHDADRTTKHIDFQTVGENIRLQLRCFCDVDYGGSYRMPFDSVMELFAGDWQDGAEIYRKWFEENLPEGLKKISQSEELPRWYGESPVVVAYPIRGRFDTDVMEPNCYYPYENAMKYLRELKEKTDSKLMPLLMHWEGTAPWAPPYVWPPYGGEAQFCSFVEKIHQENMLVGLYCSGMGWTQQSNLIADYNQETRFQENNLASVMCTNTDGTLESVICQAQRRGYDLCPACEQTKELLVKALKPAAESGIDYLQVFDQNHGGNSYFCYSSSHGHTPAPGKWQARHSRELMERLQNGKILLGCETAAAEPFLSQLKFSDNRFELTYYVGMPVPLYSYLYHEYVNNFMGNQICMMLSMEEYNYPYRVAYSFIAGDMLTVVLGEDGKISYAWGNDCFRYHTDKEDACRILKNLNGWRQEAGRNYLHMGKMVKPLPVSCGTNRFIKEDGDPLEVDQVLTSAYEFAGQRMQFVVNYNREPVTVSVDTPVSVAMDSKMETVYPQVSAFSVPALSAVAIW